MGRVGMGWEAVSESAELRVRHLRRNREAREKWRK